MALNKTSLTELRRRQAGKTGNRLADAIELSGETQAAVASALTFSQQYVSDVVRGRYTNITLPNARKFADHFGCTIEDLFPESRAVAS